MLIVNNFSVLLQHGEDLTGLGDVGGARVYFDINGSVSCAGVRRQRCVGGEEEAGCCH